MQKNSKILFQTIKTFYFQYYLSLQIIVIYHQSVTSLSLYLLLH